MLFHKFNRPPAPTSESFSKKKTPFILELFTFQSLVKYSLLGLLKELSRYLPKKVICAKNATTKIRFSDVYRLTSNMFTICTGNLFEILYRC